MHQLVNMNLRENIKRILREQDNFGSCTDPRWVNLPWGSPSGTPGYPKSKHNYCDRCLGDPDSSDSFIGITWGENGDWSWDWDSGISYCKCCLKDHTSPVKPHRPNTSLTLKSKIKEELENSRLPEKFYDSDYELDEFDLDEIFDEMRKGDRVRYFVDVYYDTMLPSSGDPEKDKILAEKMARADMMNLKNREYIIGPVELRGYYR